MLVIELKLPFKNSASIKARSNIKAFLSSKSYGELSTFRESLEKREQVSQVTCYSAHIVDWAIMHAKGKKDFEDILNVAGGSSDFRIMYLSNIMHSTQKISQMSLIYVAEQQVTCEKIKKRENNRALKLLRKVFG